MKVALLLLLSFDLSAQVDWISGMRNKPFFDARPNGLTATCGGTVDQSTAINAINGNAAVHSAWIPPNCTMFAPSYITPTTNKRYYGQGKLKFGAYLQGQDQQWVETLPFSGPSWSFSSSPALVSVVVTSTTTATVITSAAHNLPATGALVQVSGFVTEDRLNTGTGVVAATVDSPTQFHYTMATAGVNGSYTDSSALVEDRSNPYFQGDDSQIDSRNYIIDSFSRLAPNTRYFNYELPKSFTQWDVRSGASGSLAVLTMDAGPTAMFPNRVYVNDTTQFTTVAGASGHDNVIILDQGSAVAETRTVTAISAGSYLTVNVNLRNAHTVASNATVGRGGRTQQALEHVEVITRAGAQGDIYRHLTNLICGGVAIGGQTDSYLNTTCGIDNGSLTASSPNEYLQISEYQAADGGNDITGIFHVMTYTRTARASYPNNEWVHDFAQSIGSQPVDAGYVLAGRFNVGLDLSRQIPDGALRGIQMPANLRIYRNSSYSAGTFGKPLEGNVTGDAFDLYNGSTGRYNFFTHNATALEFDQTAFVIYGKTTFNGAGTPISSHYSGTATWSPGAILDGKVATTTVTVTGCPDGANTSVGFPGTGATAGLGISAIMNGSTAKVTLRNDSGGTVTPPSGTLRVSCQTY